MLLRILRYFGQAVSRLNQANRQVGRQAGGLVGSRHHPHTATINSQFYKAGHILHNRILRLSRILRYFGQAVSRLVWADRQPGQRAAVIIHMVVNTLGIADGRNFLNYSYPNLRPSTHLFKSETRCKDWTSWLVSA